MRVPLVGRVLFIVVLLGGVGAAAWAAGAHWDDRRSTIEVVNPQADSGTGGTTVVQLDRGHRGFFPGFLLFPLIIFGLFWAFGGRRRHWHDGHWQSGPGSFEEWHERQHRGASGPPAAPGSGAESGA